MSTKADSAYRQLRDLIQKGSVSPGERITEALAAKMVGMGRGPVRESLLRLEAEGWLRHKGEHQSRVVVYVEDQDPREMLFRYELREQIDPRNGRDDMQSVTEKDNDDTQQDSIREDVGRGARCVMSGHLLGMVAGFRITNRRAGSAGELAAQSEARED